MEHPDEGMIRALLDREAPGNMEGLQAHLEECPRCAEAATGQEADLQTLLGALSLLDMEPPVHSARARVLRKARANQRPWRSIRRTLPRAASFVILITASAAAALPGSPIRRWLVAGWDSFTGAEDPSRVESVTGEGQTATEGAGSRPGLVGATLLVGERGMELHVTELSSDASLTIVLVEGDRAGAFAGEGTRFHTEEGRLEASGPPGDVRLEVPSRAQPITVFVNGEVYLRKTDRGMELLGPVRTRTPTEIRFGPAGPPSNGPASEG